MDIEFSDFDKERNGKSHSRIHAHINKTSAEKKNGIKITEKKKEENQR